MDEEHDTTQEDTDEDEMEESEIDVTEIDLTPREVDEWIAKLIELKEEGKEQTFELDDENELTIRLVEETEFGADDLDEDEE